MAALIWAPDQRSRLVLLGIYLFLALQLAAVMYNFAGPISLEFELMRFGDRYYTITKVALIWELAVLAQALSKARPALRGSLLAAIFVGPLLVTGNHLRRRQLPDLRWEEQADELDSGARSTIEIHPESWRVRVQHPHTAR